MRNGTLRRAYWCAALGVALLALLPALASASSTHGVVSSRTLGPHTRFFSPGPSQGAIQQGLQLLRQGRIRDALLLGAMEVQPHAVWLTQGTPAEVQAQVRKTLFLADFQHAVPVLVAYNIPGRDCAGLSAGGAATTDAYKAWIDGVAAGIGDHKAVVTLAGAELRRRRRRPPGQARHAGMAARQGSRPVRSLRAGRRPRRAAAGLPVHRQRPRRGHAGQAARPRHHRRPPDAADGPRRHLRRPGQAGAAARRVRHRAGAGPGQDPGGAGADLGP